MARTGRGNEENIHALHQVEGGEKVPVCVRGSASASRRSFWKKQFAGLGLSAARVPVAAPRNSQLKEVFPALVHSSGQPGEECLHRKLQRPAPRRMPQCACLRMTIEAQRVLDAWRHDYNHIRPPTAACRIERLPQWAQCESTHVSYLSRLQLAEIGSKPKS
jgi:hypothetical protein